MTVYQASKRAGEKDVEEREDRGQSERGKRVRQKGT
jgi:hypothetical protein